MLGKIFYLYLYVVLALIYMSKQINLRNRGFSGVKVWTCQAFIIGGKDLCLCDVSVWGRSEVAHTKTKLLSSMRVCVFVCLERISYYIIFPIYH